MNIILFLGQRNMVPEGAKSSRELFAELHWCSSILRMLAGQDGIRSSLAPMP
jgi:hypothetical protein